MLLLLPITIGSLEALMFGPGGNKTVMAVSEILRDLEKPEGGIISFRSKTCSEGRLRDIHVPALELNFARTPRWAGVVGSDGSLPG
jgi:hypothetical protein